MMIANIYLSEANYKFSALELEQLSQLAAKHNAEFGVTGYLCYMRDRFLQYIEGEEETISALMENICTDERHQLIYKVRSGCINERLFPTWSMRLITNADLQRYKFQSELCIEHNLLYIKNNFLYKERCEQLLWSHIETISQINAAQQKNSQLHFESFS